MSLIPYYSFDLSDYETKEELEELLADIENEVSTLLGYQRGARRKYDSIEDEEENDSED